MGFDYDAQNPRSMFVVPLTTKRDEKWEKIEEELCTKDLVKGSCHGGEGSYPNDKNNLVHEKNKSNF